MQIVMIMEILQQLLKAYELTGDLVDNNDDFDDTDITIYPSKWRFAMMLIMIAMVVSMKVF